MPDPLLERLKAIHGPTDEGPLPINPLIDFIIQELIKIRKRVGSLEKEKAHLEKLLTLVRAGKPIPARDRVRYLGEKPQRRRIPWWKLKKKKPRH